MQEFVQSVVQPDDQRDDQSPQNITSIPVYTDNIVPPQNRGTASPNSKEKLFSC